MRLISGLLYVLFIANNDSSPVNCFVIVLFSGCDSLSELEPSEDETGSSYTAPPGDTSRTHDDPCTGASF